MAILGTQGYSGLVLANLLINHPFANLVLVFSRDPQWNLAEDLPLAENLNIPHYTLDVVDETISLFDVIFLATPIEASSQWVPYFIKQGKVVIDLSGAYRLSSEIPDASYGLSPFNTQLGKFISNPGCYATCALMALLPLLKHKLIDPNDIIIDAKSGVTGAGRQGKKELLFGEMVGNFYPYKISQHQHIPEIEKYLQVFSECQATVDMVTHLLPVKQGISMTLYLKSDNPTYEGIEQAFSDAYQDYPFVKTKSLEKNQNTIEKTFMGLNKIVATPYTHIAYKIVKQRIYLVATLDNLYKGAASQAIENFNQLYQLPLTAGLIPGGGA